MGNSRFKFSDMIPNAWLYKLKDMAKPINTENTQNPSKSKQQPHHFNPRKSCHFTRELVPLDGFYVSPDPPRKSPNKRYYSRRRNFRSTGCSCRETANSPLDYSASSSSLSSSDDGSPLESSDADAEKIDELPELELPPIVTKPAKFNDMKTKRNNKDKNMSPVRKFSVGVRLRTHSPRIGSRRLIQGHGRSTLAVVKSSVDPERDFRESMVEMIVENNIRRSKELEELLASYLSLNSDENHEVIIKVFKQIWFDLNHFHFNY
ncbi:ovate family protein 1, ARABIDOPSIS THALIANA OVATE FAMILY PROTEIN 1 [Hibiscus trionum]|uniref:Transcription repressor n=1 Tax=Hibiscus trionum TaxID=183268 RepID=A0A9W7LHL5_HIBTR|nr:ovate family protein 1, ARABIDOPSIS THALIANA OVATE FAMILY PROTEIN 1 [Hibiscus trionum]